VKKSVSWDFISSGGNTLSPLPLNNSANQGVSNDVVGYSGISSSRGFLVQPWFVVFLTD